LPDNDPEVLSPLLERCVAEILRVEERKVEGKEDQAVGMPADRLLNRPEVRAAGLILDDHLSIDHCRSAAQLHGGGDGVRFGLLSRS
jgi:hypothetical protein